MSTTNAAYTRQLSDLRWYVIHTLVYDKMLCVLPVALTSTSADLVYIHSYIHWPATFLIPIEFSFPFRGGGALRYSVPKWLLFLINVGSGFHCLRSSSFLFYRCCVDLYDGDF
jgi:hypothetical protein